jgi:mRNA interferase RelE/StbE
MIAVIFRPHALKDLKKLPKSTQRFIFDKISYFASQKNTLAYAKRLKNLDIGTYRFRIGDYRVIFDVSDIKIIVLRIGHRRDIYR